MVSLQQKLMSFYDAEFGASVKTHILLSKSILDCF